jgi:hypothetical protein
MKAIKNGARRPRAAVARAGSKRAKVTKPVRSRKISRTTKLEDVKISIDEVDDTTSETATSLDELRSAAAEDAMQELEDRINNVQGSWETESILGDLLEELTDSKGVLGGKLTYFPFVDAIS